MRSVVLKPVASTDRSGWADRSQRLRRGVKPVEGLIPVVVLVLLSALSVVAIPAAQPRRVKLAFVGICSGGAVSKMIDQFNFHCGRFPTALRELNTQPADVEVARKWRGPYIKDIEGLMDPWGHEYVYQAPGTHNEKSFDLSSMGPDGKPDTEDDIRNWKTD
ncbi:MAG: type II secretion system protein GspG [Phycisphaerae bacterium]